MNTEIEKALNEFNEVMAELKNSSILKDEHEEEDVSMMDEEMAEAPVAEETPDVSMAEYKAEESEDVEEEDYSKAEDEELKEFVEFKKDSINTLDLSKTNIEKAYDQFKSEREEERAYEVIKGNFESRYLEELKNEAETIAKSKFNAADAVLSLKEEFSQLKKSLENNTIAKAAEVQSVSESLSEDFSNIAEMSWNEVHQLMDKHNRGA